MRRESRDKRKQRGPPRPRRSTGRPSPPIVHLGWNSKVDAAFVHPGARGAASLRVVGAGAAVSVRDGADGGRGARHRPWRRAGQRSEAGRLSTLRERRAPADPRLRARRLRRRRRSIPARSRTGHGFAAWNRRLGDAYGSATPQPVPLHRRLRAPGRPQEHRRRRPQVPRRAAAPRHLRLDGRPALHRQPRAARSRPGRDGRRKPSRRRRHDRPRRHGDGRRKRPAGRRDQRSQRSFRRVRARPRPSKSLYGALTFYRYIRLAQTLGRFPGKKAVVLFSDGMRVDDANLDLVSRFAAEAMRARVSFYTVDTRRLSAGSEYDAESSAAPSRLMTQAFQDQQDGLFTLAKSSGGKAIQNTNRMGEIFDAVLEDSSEYYILGYYPQDVTKDGRFRKIRVEVDRERLRLDYRKGYYEDKAFEQMTDAEKRLELLHALEQDTAFSDVPLSAGFELFRGAEGQTVLGYSIGLHPSSLPAERKGKGWEVDFSIAAQATRIGDESGSDGEHGSAVEERRLRMRVPADYYERMQSDPSARLQYVSQMRLPAGRYQWRVVVRDEATGKLGSYKAVVTAPDFPGGYPASSLLVTTRVQDRPQPNNRRKKRRRGSAAGPFDIESYRLSPDSDRIFRRGDPLYALYDVYSYPTGRARQAGQRQARALPRQEARRLDPRAGLPRRRRSRRRLGALPDRARYGQAPARRLRTRGARADGQRG
ncbi:MAG: VWA domain-containing protein [Bryobacterales bacterium]